MSATEETPSMIGCARAEPLPIHRTRSESDNGDGIKEGGGGGGEGGRGKEGAQGRQGGFSLLRRGRALT